MGVQVTIPLTSIPGPVTVTGNETVTGTLTAAGAFAHTGATAGLYGVAPVARAGAIAAPTAPGVAYLQAEAQSAVAAINSIRAALSGLGVTA